jgi:DNA polymerase III epsilon subunit-like protein
MVADAPTIEDVLAELLEFVGEATLVAHNIQFELKFLSRECSRLQMKPPPRTLCTLKLARKLYPEFQNHKLGTILDAFEIAPDGPLHRALPDAKATAQMLLHLQKRHAIDVLN